MKVKKRVAFAGVESALSAGWRYENRNYDHITPALAAVRDDERNLLDAEWEFPIKDKFFVAVHMNYNMLKSNLASVNYNETIYGIRLGASF